jgi:hypothetical protein
MVQEVLRAFRNASRAWWDFCLTASSSRGLKLNPVLRIKASSDGDDRYNLPPGTDPQNSLGWSFAKHLASDQKAFWSSGKELSLGGVKTFLPLAGFTGLLIASDSWPRQVPDKPNLPPARANRT